MHDLAYHNLHIYMECIYVQPRLPQPSHGVECSICVALVCHTCTGMHNIHNIIHKIQVTRSAAICVLLWVALHISTGSGNHTPTPLWGTAGNVDVGNCILP